MGNPWALCNWLAKKHRWTKAKKEKCIKSVKSGRHRRRRIRYGKAKAGLRYPKGWDPRDH